MNSTRDDVSDSDRRSLIWCTCTRSVVPVSAQGGGRVQLGDFDAALFLSVPRQRRPHMDTLRNDATSTAVLAVVRDNGQVNMTGVISGCRTSAPPFEQPTARYPARRLKLHEWSRGGSQSETVNGPKSLHTTNAPLAVGSLAATLRTWGRR